MWGATRLETGSEAILVQAQKYVKPWPQTAVFMSSFSSEFHMKVMFFKLKAQLNFFLEVLSSCVMTQEHTYGLSEAWVLLIKSNYRNEIKFGDSCMWSLASETTALYFQALLYFNIISIKRQMFRCCATIKMHSEIRFCAEVAKCGVKIHSRQNWSSTTRCETTLGVRFQRRLEIWNTSLTPAAAKPFKRK